MPPHDAPPYQRNVHAAVPDGRTRLVVTRDAAFEIREVHDDLSSLDEAPDGTPIALDDRVSHYLEPSETPVEPGPRPAGGGRIV